MPSRCIVRKRWRFVQFALNAANDSKVKSPSLWLAAASMIDYLFGNTERAMAEAEKAVASDGSQRMRDNARAIRLLASTRPISLQKNILTICLASSVGLTIR